MPDKSNVPPDDQQNSPTPQPDASGLQEALDSANLPDEERKAVQDTLERGTPPDPDEVLAGESEDAVLAADPEDPLTGETAESADDEAELDEVLADAGSSSGERKAVGGENSAADEDAMMSQELLDELIADADPGAAKAEQNTSESEDDEPEVSQDVLDSLLADVEQKPAPAAKRAAAKPAKSPAAIPPPRRVVRGGSTRMIVSLVVGLFGAVVVIYFLSANRLRPLTQADLAAGMQQNQLDTAVEDAQLLMSDGEYGDAAARLRVALIDAPASPLKVDAEFLYLEAVSKSLPDRFADETAGAYHSGVDRLIELAPLHPKAPTALYLNAKVYEAEQNPLAARAQYRDVLEDYPDALNRDEILLAAGQLELELENPITAADYFEQIISGYPGSPLVDRARLHMGDALSQAGNYDGARITFVRLAQAHPGTALGDEAFERLGRLAFETGDYESAIRELETRLTMSTSIEGNDRIYLLLAKTYAASGEQEKALELLRELIDFFPESEVMPFAHIELSRVQSSMDMNRDATRTATQAVDRYPDHAAVQRNAGELLAQAGRNGDAAAAYETAYGAGDRDPEVLLEAGRLYGAAEQYADAKRVLDTLQLEHATAPEALDAAIVWSELQFNQGQVTAAINGLESMAEVTRDRAQQLRLKSVLAKLYERIGFVEEAARIYAEIPHLTDDPAMLARSALALLAAGNTEEGLDAAERVEVGGLSDEDAYRFLVAKGKALMAGDLRQALDTLESAHEIYPMERTPEGDRLLLRANLAAGRTARARTVMVDMRAQFENNPEAAKWLTQAANEWGDFLYNRRDYRAAADAYSYASVASASEAEGAEAWALYQRANALYKMADFKESLRLYERVSKTTSPWAAEAASKVETVKLDMKLRGIAVPETREAG